MLENLGDFIAQVGFPTFVAIYLLARLEPTIKSLEKSVSTLTIVLARMNGVDLEKAKQMSGEKDCGGG